ncbi:MAG: hypothetical protein F6K40_12255 [Okeania sp. SIO3I5]|uniref:hypothetical protein n=1 Tax=Okeania sp. SIO3I5 TaxID=2607805 RepID=UPI0013B7376C|nr:hypothetical protein [Okeania sp. SIO3I5]NEQ37002.1 hypothetical protein [Okeania sp. SIO3I5]
MPKGSGKGRGKGGGRGRGQGKGISNWGDDILEELFKQRGIDVDIKKDTNLGKLLQTDRSKPYRIKFNSKNEISIISTPEKFLENINQVLISRQAIAWFLGDYDFNEWFDEEFAWEFRKNLPSTKRLPLDLINPWGKDAKNRPKKVSLLPPEIVANEGHQKILFYPDRTVEENILMVGTYYELRRQLVDYMRSSKLQETEEECTKYIQTDRATRHPYLRLYFAGGYFRNAPDYKEIKPRAVMNIRLNKFVIFPDEKKDGESLLDEKDMKHFSEKIRDNFFPGGSPLTWEKGYYSWPYKDEEKKITLAPIAKTEGDALRVIKAALNTIGVNFEEENFFLPSGAKNIARYKRKKKVLVLGQEFSDKRKTRITGTVAFRYAEIRLDAIKYRVKICEVTKSGVFIGWDKIPKPAIFR